MDGTEFEIPTKPVPASRPQVNRSTGAAFYPKGHRAYEGFLKKFLTESVAPYPLNEPCEVKFLFVFEPYKTSDHPVYRADNDNLSKLPMDGLTKAGKKDKKDTSYLFWKDDDLVVSLVSLKRFAREGEEPHTKVKIKKIGTNYADYVDEVFDA